MLIKSINSTEKEAVLVEYYWKKKEHNMMVKSVCLKRRLSTKFELKYISKIKTFSSTKSPKEQTTNPWPLLFSCSSHMNLQYNQLLGVLY